MGAAATATETGDALRVRWAAERTLLAWVRTSLALYGLGFVTARLVIVDMAGGGGLHAARHVAELASQVLGVAFVFMGAVATAAAALRYREFLVDASPAGRRPRGAAVSYVLSAFVSVLGILLGLSLIVVSE